MRLVRVFPLAARIVIDAFGHRKGSRRARRDPHLSMISRAWMPVTADDIGRAAVRVTARSLEASILGVCVHVDKFQVGGNFRIGFTTQDFPSYLDRRAGSSPHAMDAPRNSLNYRRQPTLTQFAPIMWAPVIPSIRHVLRGRLPPHRITQVTIATIFVALGHAASVMMDNNGRTNARRSRGRNE